MSLPSQSRISFSRINENIRFTGGNVGINTSTPTSTLDVSGTARITTSITSEAVYATNSTVTNSVSTNTSSGTLNLSTGITSASAQMANLVSTNSTMTNLRSTLSSIGTLRTDLGVMTEGLMVKASISTSLTVPNLLVTTSVSSGAVYATDSTVTNSVSTNISSGTLNLSTGLTAGTILATTSISSGEVNATNSTVTNLYSLNSTLSNLRSTLSSIGTLRTDLGVITEGLMVKASISTSLTVPNLLVTTSVSSGAVYATNSTVTNFVATSITAGTIVVTNNVNSAQGITVYNPNSGSSAYSGLTLVTDQVSNFNIFKNSTTRTLDGGVNTVTMRNDGGPLRLQSNTGLGVWVGSTGNVGINTTTPTVLLDVSGNFRARSDNTHSIGHSTTDTRLDIFACHRRGVATGGWMSFDPNGGTTGSSGLHIYDELDVNGAVTTGSLYVNGAGSFRGSLYVNHAAGGNTPQINVSPNANTAESSIGFWQNTNNGGALWAIGHNPSGVGNNNFAIYSSTFGGNALSILNNGNVGIGTNSPGYKLDVNGSFATNTMLIRSTSYSTTLANQVYNGNTWYTAIAPNILQVDATFIVSLSFTSGATPWNIYASFLHMIGFVNDNQALSTSGANVPTSIHANNSNGIDYQIKVRGSYAPNSSGGIQFSVNSTTPSGSWTVKAYRIV